MKNVATILVKKAFKKGYAKSSLNAFFFLTIRKHDTYHMERRGCMDMNGLSTGRRSIKNMGKSNFAGIEGFPSEVLQKYKINVTEGKKENKFWLIKSREKSYAAWEYTSNIEILEMSLKWQDYLRQNGFTKILPYVKTATGENYVKVNKKNYYITEFIEGKPLDFQRREDLLELARTLAEIYACSRNFEYEKIGEKEISWLKIKQDRLTELLFFYQYLSDKKLINDYERLYMENFKTYYNRGQEAIEKMVMAGYNPSNKAQTIVLMGNFLEENIVKINSDLMFLHATSCIKGPMIMDLSLLLCMCLPKHKWDWELAKDIIMEYQKKVQLNMNEKYMLLAQLYFPRRFWMYSYRYFKGDGELNNITEKLKKYLYETYWQDKCLNKLENWMLEEENNEYEG